MSKKRKIIDDQESSFLREGDLPLAEIALNFLANSPTNIFQSKEFKALRTLIFPLLLIQKAAFFEQACHDSSMSSVALDISSPPFVALINAVRFFTSSPSEMEIFKKSIKFKSFRKAMHPLVLKQVNNLLLLFKYIS